MAIDRAFTGGITDGCPTLKELTCPDLAVTRDEIARFLWRFRNLPGSPTCPPMPPNGPVGR